MDYFGTYNTADELKKDYDYLQGKFNSDTETLAEIKEQFSDVLEDLSFKLGITADELKKQVVEVIIKGEEVTVTEVEEKKETVVTEKKETPVIDDSKIKAILEKISGFNMRVEVIGSWIWCFDSYEYREQLKEMGFWYSGCKKAWIYNGGQKSYKRRGQKLATTRAHYGSTVLKDKKEEDK